MGIFSILEERQSPGPFDDFWYESTTGAPGEGDVNPHSALSSTPVWAAVNLIAGTIGSLPLILYREMENGGKERATDLSLFDLFRWQPNGARSSLPAWQRFFPAGDESRRRTNRYRAVAS